MIRTRKIYVFFLAAMMAMLLCPACDKDMPTVQHITGGEQNTEGKPTEIIISHSQNLNTPEDLAARAMQKRLQELLGEQAKVILYADYQLGSAREQLEALQLDRIHITIQPVSAVSAFEEDLNVFLLPYLFSANADEVMAVLDGPLGQEALEHIGMEPHEQTFEGLGLWFGGYKLFTFHGDDHKHIQSPADFQGLRISIPDNALLKAQYTRWGAVPVAADTIAYYSILAQQMADGSEATASQIASDYLYEVQHNIVQAYHSAEIYTVLANHQWYESLSSDIQNAILEAELYAKETLYKALAEQEPIYIEQIQQAKGMRYEVLTEKEQAVFKASIIPLYVEQLSGNPWQIDYVARIQKCFT